VRADPALKRLARAIIEPTSGDATELLFVPRRGAAKACKGNGSGDAAASEASTAVDSAEFADNNPIADVISHEFAGDATAGRKVQFLYDTKHRRFRLTAKWVAGLATRICSALDNALLQHDKCVVDHVVFVLVARIDGEIDLDKLLDAEHHVPSRTEHAGDAMCEALRMRVNAQVAAASAGSPGHTAAPVFTHKDAIRKALGRLKSFHIVVLQPHDAGLQRLLSQLVAFTLPLMDAHDRDAKEKMLPVSKAEWRRFCAGDDKDDANRLFDWSKRLYNMRQRLLNERKTNKQKHSSSGTANEVVQLFDTVNGRT
jgi:hypothetical protein